MMADANNRPGAPSWLDGLKFYADLRLRYQFDRKNKTNGAKDQGDRNRARYEAIGESDRMTLRFRKPSA